LADSKRITQSSKEIYENKDLLIGLKITLSCFQYLRKDYVFMFCIVAFIILSILGIFSASNRALAKEALDCVLHRVTFRPCKTGFDQKIKAKILGKLLYRSESIARFVNKYFELLTWVFFLTFIISGFIVGRSLYNFYRYGNCHGLSKETICILQHTP